MSSINTFVFWLTDHWCLLSIQANLRNSQEFSTIKTFFKTFPVTNLVLNVIVFHTNITFYHVMHVKTWRFRRINESTSYKSSVFLFAFTLSNNIMSVWWAICVCPCECTVFLCVLCLCLRRQPPCCDCQGELALADRMGAYLLVRLVVSMCISARLFHGILGAISLRGRNVVKCSREFTIMNSEGGNYNKRRQ